LGILKHFYSDNQIKGKNSSAHCGRMKKTKTRSPYAAGKLYLQCYTLAEIFTRRDQDGGDEMTPQQPATLPALMFKLARLPFRDPRWCSVTSTAADLTEKSQIY
jgi:hypothetical protein